MALLYKLMSKSFLSLMRDVQKLLRAPFHKEWCVEGKLAGFIGKMTWFRVLLFTLYFIVGMATKTLAQFGGFTIGLERSPQLSWLHSNDQLVKTSSAWGDNYGVLLEYNFPRRLGLSVNFIVARQKVGFQSEHVKYTLRNRYFKIPLMLTYIHDPLAQATFIGRIGPQVSLLNRSGVNNGEGYSSTKQYMRESTVGLAAYGGFRLFIVDMVALNFGVRVDQDFLEMNKVSENGAFPLPKGKNASVSIVFGVNILHF